MELKDQVSSLELSKKLKELGVKQDSLYWWTPFNSEKDDGKYSIWTCPHADDKDPYKVNDKCFSAFTSSELSMLLPDNCSPYREDGKWKSAFVLSDQELGKKTFGFQVTDFESHKEVDTKAKMLIYILENKLLDKKVVGIKPLTMHLGYSKAE